MDKHEIRREIKDKIDDAFHSVQKLENKSEELSGRKKEELEERIAVLQTKKDKMDSFYEELLNSSEEKANEIRDKFEESKEDFKAGFNKIAEAF